MRAKQNCWEQKRCGRQPGGASVTQLGVCPAAAERRLDGANGGVNGGRSCWIMAGTLCGGQVQGSFAAKLANCKNCEFYKKVQQEEPQVSRARDLLALIGI
ncbi:MAG: hypothetical protein KC619_04700 [Myxococcales bacterium]|nr:hypothetical protein [Myxococcales bacterium]